MRADQVRKFALPAPEQLTVPELGGDGVVTVRPLGFGERIDLLRGDRPESRSARLCAAAVVDEDGQPLMDANAWDAFAYAHEDQFIVLLTTVTRLAGLDGDAVKKA